MAKPIKKKLPKKTRSSGHTQERGLQTRRRLLEVTAQVIGAEGVHNLRYSHVAKIAKVPQALLGYHFPNLESLLLEVVNQELQKVKTGQVQAVEKHAAQPKKAIAAYIRAPFELASRDASFRSVFSAFYHLAVVSPTFADLNSTIRKLGRERIVNLITMVLATEGQFMGLTTITRDRLIELATSVQGVITGMALMAASETGADYQEMADVAVETCFKVLGLDS